MATHGRRTSLTTEHRKDGKVGNPQSFGVTHGIDELLCPACHRTLGTRVYHLGEEHRLLATRWL